ncbi:MAG: hypothetical protein WCK02_15360 [Bacteroidota bacterium]
MKVIKKNQNRKLISKLGLNYFMTKEEINGIIGGKETCGRNYTSCGSAGLNSCGQNYVDSCFLFLKTTSCNYSYNFMN